MAILGILAGAGIPGLQGLLASNRVTNEVNQISHSLRYAWSEAITRNETLVACPSADGRSCMRSKDWGKGWLIFADSNDNRELDDDEAVKRIYPAVTHKITVELAAFGPRGQYIPFYPTDGMRTNGTFKFCVEGAPELNRALIVSKARPRVSKTMRDGKPVKCSI